MYTTHILVNPRTPMFISGYINHRRQVFNFRLDKDYPNPQTPGQVIKDIMQRTDKSHTLSHGLYKQAISFIKALLLMTAVKHTSKNIKKHKKQNQNE